MHRLVTLIIIALWILTLTACATGDQARVNPEFPVERPSDLSPPIVHNPVIECARAVYITGFVPRADIEVFVNSIELVGEATPRFGFAEVELTRPLDVGEVITATQTVNSIESAHSLEPVTVKSLPDFSGGVPPAPVVDTEIYDCGRIVRVGGLVPGARVFVHQDGMQIGQANAATQGKAVFTNALIAHSSVDASQAVCHDVPEKTAILSPLSVAETVRPVPDPFREPVLEEDTVVIGNDAVTLHDLYVGSRVTVFDGASSLASGIANSTRNWVPLPGPLVSTGSIRGEHELCGTSSSSGSFIPSAQLGTPQIVGPVCDTDLNVRVKGSVINATAVLLRNGSIAGMAGATPGELLIPRGEPFAVGDQLTVVQFMGSNAGAVSAPVEVCACSDAWVRGRIEEILSDRAPEQMPHSCGPSPTRLFQNTDPFDVLDVTVRADFDKINGEPSKSDARSPGVLSYVDPLTGAAVNLDTMVEARGNSRFSFCNWRPLRLRFDPSPTGLLGGTGKQIKIGTHCDWIPDPILVGAGIEPGTPTEDTRRLLQEFAMYEALETLGSTALETRLINLTYEDPSGTELKQEYAFFRERESRAAQRCGFERLESDEGDPSFPPDPTSDFQVDFHHNFLFSHDFNAPGEHNVIRMGSPNGKQYYMPYDFDLSGVIHPTYTKNNGWSIEENGEQLISMLESWPDQPLTRVQAAVVLQNETEMRQIVSGGPLDAPGKARLMHWLDDHLRRLKCFLN